MAKYRSSIELPEAQRDRIINLLNGLVANSVDLFTQVKHAHWNIKGRHFFSRHQLFDRVAKHLRNQSDELAERAAMLGGYVQGTARMVSQASAIPEYRVEATFGEEHVRELVIRLSAHGAQLRAGIEQTAEQALNDPVTQDLLIQVLREVEMDLWFLESHLLRPSAPEAEASAHPS